MLIDGGFVKTYRDRLKPRLKQMRDELLLAADEPLCIDHVVVTHIDNDHIAGMARLFRELRDAKTKGNPLPWEIGALWHNSFADALTAATGRASLPDDVVNRADAGTAGLAEGRELRDHAEVLDLSGNPPFDGLVVTPRVVNLEGGLEITLVGPTQDRLDKLRDSWEEHKPKLASGDAASVAAFVDDSIPNLSSIAMHVRTGDQTMLLTGDARGDDTLLALDEAGLTDTDGRCRVDILKVPHHGSEHNVDVEYFERLPADHYVISANGRDDNPAHETLQMIVDSQSDRAYAFHLTYEADTAGFFVSDQTANARNYNVIVRPETEASIVVDLADPIDADFDDPVD